jgi:glycosyltransferase involved in cell wall biosynthesis
MKRAVNASKSNKYNIYDCRPMEKSNHLSVAIITRNEEENLPACLRSVEFAGQIVVVDSESSDGTPEVARRFGCDVYNQPWMGFGPQKQFAVDKCRNKWVLVLDADERIPAETAEKIRELVAKESEFTGYSFPRKNYFQGKWIRHLGWWPDRIVRLFLSGKGRISPVQVHEAVVVNGAIKPLDAVIEHYTESSFSKILQKIDNYSTLAAGEAFREGKTSSQAEAVTRAILTFLYDYFIRLGILDGPQGLTLSVTDAVNKYFKYAKLDELNRLASSGGLN